MMLRDSLGPQRSRVSRKRFSRYKAATPLRNAETEAASSRKQQLLFRLCFTRLFHFICLFPPCFSRYNCLVAIRCFFSFLLNAGSENYFHWLADESNNIAIKDKCCFSVHGAVSQLVARNKCRFETKLFSPCFLSFSRI